MKNSKIGEMLKKYRKMNSMSVADVVAKLNNTYDLKVAEKTVYGWESNQAHPTADTFVVLCEMYKINDLSDALNPSPSKSGQDLTISREERELIERYRKHPELQKIVRRVLELE